MAVQKSRVTRSRRGQRRSHDGLSCTTLTTDSETGNMHRRHHIDEDGMYRGRQIVVPKIKDTGDEDSDS